MQSKREDVTDSCVTAVLPPSARKTHFSLIYMLNAFVGLCFVCILTSLRQVASQPAKSVLYTINYGWFSWAPAKVKVSGVGVLRRNLF